jgi:hypothetical protein
MSNNMPQTAANPATAGSGSTAAAKGMTVEQKKAARQQELCATYDTIRALPQSLAVVLRLNQPIEMKPVTPMTASDNIDEGAATLKKDKSQVSAKAKGGKK